MSGERLFWKSRLKTRWQSPNKKSSLRTIFNSSHYQKKMRQKQLYWNTKYNFPYSYIIKSITLTKLRCIYMLQKSRLSLFKGPYNINIFLKIQFYTFKSIYLLDTANYFNSFVKIIQNEKLKISLIINNIYFNFPKL